MDVIEELRGDWGRVRGVRVDVIEELRGDWGRVRGGPGGLGSG